MDEETRVSIGPKGVIAVLAAAFLVLLVGGAQAALTSHWSFDEGTGTTVTDTVAGLVGNFSPSGVGWGAGKAGSALTFSGSGYVDMGNVMDLNGMGTSYSVVVWVENTITGDYGAVVARHRSETGAGYVLAVGNIGMYGVDGYPWFYNGWGWTTPISGGDVTPSTKKVNDGYWHQIVGVRDKDTNMVSIYVDGVFQASHTDQNLGSVDVHLLVGGYTANDGVTPFGHYIGSIDDLQMYNQALTSGEIAYLYSNPGEQVPLPGTLLLLGSGLAGLAAIRRRFTK